MKSPVATPSAYIQRASHCEPGHRGQASHCQSSDPENALIESVEMVNGRPDPGRVTPGVCMLALVRIAAKGKDLPLMTSNKFERYCKELVIVLSDEAKSLNSFKSAITALDKALAGDYSRDKAKDASLLLTAASHI